MDHTRKDPSQTAPRPVGLFDVFWILRLNFFLSQPKNVYFSVGIRKRDWLDAPGLVWRLKDANNYYIVRANALENNVVLYRSKTVSELICRLKPKDAYGKKASVPSGQWSELRVAAHGNLFQVFVNGQKLYEVEDNTFTEAGKVGLWTKADSVTFFDDQRVTAK